MLEFIFYFLFIIFYILNAQKHIIVSTDLFKFIHYYVIFNYKKLIFIYIDKYTSEL